jgi:hypothetical protein
MSSGIAALFAGVAVASTTPYAVVAHLAGVPVRAPTNRTAWGACPRGTVAIGSAEMIDAKRAVLAALPTIAKEAHRPLNTRGARVTAVTHTRRDGFIMPLRSCWGTAFKRSVLVKVFLPTERRTPSLTGNPWFYVARTKTSWVIWDEPR